MDKQIFKGSPGDVRLYKKAIEQGVLEDCSGDLNTHMSCGHVLSILDQTLKMFPILEIPEYVADFIEHPGTDPVYNIINLISAGDGDDYAITHDSVLDGVLTEVAAEKVSKWTQGMGGSENITKLFLGYTVKQEPQYHILLRTPNTEFKYATITKEGTFVTTDDLKDVPVMTEIDILSIDPSYMAFAVNVKADKKHYPED